VTASLARAARLVPGTRVTSYFVTGSRDMVGDGGHMTFATISYPLSGDRATDRMDEIRAAIGTPAGFERTLVGGSAAMEHDTRPEIEDSLRRADMIVLPAALLILLVFFGSAVGALIPLVMAGATIALAMAGTYLAGQVMTIADLVTNVITLVGVAIGISSSPGAGRHRRSAPSPRASARCSS
jgi:RND superfamily putative drug exporter